MVIPNTFAARASEFTFLNCSTTAERHMFSPADKRLDSRATSTSARFSSQFKFLNAF
jgi:hypothetical protein